MFKNKKLVRYKSFFKGGGFTLIELMLVVIIIGVLAAIVVPRFSGRSREAKISAAKAEINGSLSTAVDLFELDNGRFPKTENFPEALIKSPSDLESSWKGPYLKKRVPEDPWGKAYNYKRDSDYLPGYKIWTTTPSGEEISNVQKEGS